MKLYSYYRSSAAYRVRIALNLKGLDVEQVAVNLLTGEQRDAAYRERNPQGLVPALDIGDALLTQSLAIVEYLDEVHPEPLLIPAAPLARARVRAMAEVIACDIHPLNNSPILAHLKDPMGHDQGQVGAWVRTWIARGFAALETLTGRHGAADGYCCGDSVTMADLFLVPQMYNARRFDTDLGPYPNLLRIDAKLTALDAFARAAPEQQPDAP